MFQEIFGKVDEFGWWYMQIIQTEAVTQFTSNDFQEGICVRGVRIELAAPDHQEINGQIEVTWKTLQIIVHSIMVHAWFSDEYIHFVLIYMTDHMFPVLLIKYLVNQDSGPTTPHKLETEKKPSVSNLHFQFCPCVLRNGTAHVGTKALNMCN